MSSGLLPAERSEGRGYEGRGPADGASLRVASTPPACRSCSEASKPNIKSNESGSTFSSPRLVGKIVPPPHHYLWTPSVRPGYCIETKYMQHQTSSPYPPHPTTHYPTPQMMDFGTYRAHLGFMAIDLCLVVSSQPLQLFIKDVDTGDYGYSALVSRGCIVTLTITGSTPEQGPKARTCSSTCPECSTATGSQCLSKPLTASSCCRRAAHKSMAASRRRWTAGFGRHALIRGGRAALCKP
jgi:hypothetical protein